MENQPIYNTRNKVPGIDEVKLIEVIYCSKKRVGLGADLSPITICVEIFDTNGNLLAQNNPLLKYTARDLFDFYEWILSSPQTQERKGPFSDLLSKWEAKRARNKEHALAR